MLRALVRPAMTAVAPRLAAAPRSPWFHSARFDVLLLLGVPFLTWPLLTALRELSGPELLSRLIVLSATGHYVATFVRTYGDRELFARFKMRLLLAPPLLLALSGAAFASGHGPALLLVTMGWAFWHWLAQAFGFARIYDLKVGSHRPLTAWLDKALVIAGFVGTVVLHDGALATFGRTFLDAGIPLPDGPAFAAVQATVHVLLVAVGAAYLADLGAAIVRGRPWSWQKQVMHATTIGYYWFAFAWLPNVAIAYVLYELFHDVQYFAITWLTCRQRLARPGTAPWFQRLFRPGARGAGGFLAAMLLCGAVDLGGRALSSDLLAVFLPLALLHYYYDGFVWKAREASLGQDLGLPGGLRAAVAPGLRHAARWLLFAVPFGLALAVGGGRQFTPRERAEALVALAPGDFHERAELALLLAQAGELTQAADHYRASIAAHPDFAPVRANFGAALELAGDLDGARAQYEHALRCADHGVAHAQAHGNLGVLLLLGGDRGAAERHFEDARRLGGVHPIGRMLALAAALPGPAVERRTRLYEGVLQLDAAEPDAHWHLGQLLAAQRRFGEAAHHFTALVLRAPDLVPGWLALAEAEAGRGEPEAARAALAQVLRREPGHARALELQRRLGGR